MSTESPDDAPLFCHRCGLQLIQGDGRTYVVQIKAFADPTPPRFEAEDLQKDHEQEMQKIAQQAGELSQQELMDQVYRQLTLWLCTSCYENWIENPTG